MMSSGLLRGTVQCDLDWMTGRLCLMSNDQWNNGQNNQWVPQPDAQNGQAPQQDWGQPQRSANEWDQQGSAQEWGQQAQGSAQEWGQQPASQGSAQEWGQQAQPSANEWGQQAQQASANEWGQQGQSANDWAQQDQQAQQQGWDQQDQQAQQQGWDQQAQQAQQQGWDQQAQQAQQQGWAGQQGQQQWQGQQMGQTPMPVAQQAGGSIFDFSFRQFSLPASASLIWIISLVCLFIEWLFGFITILASDYSTAMTITQSLLSGLAGFAVKALFIRVVLEIGIALVRLVEQTRKDDSAS